MAEVEIKEPLVDKGSNTVREEIKFQYFWYIIVLFTIYLTSLIVPSFLFMYYVYGILLPNFLDVPSFLTLFGEINSLLALIFTPLVIICCILIRHFIIGLTTRLFWKLSEKKSPSKDGIIPRNFSSRILNFYHIRSFLLKYGKNYFTKGVFPWLANWFYNFVGSSKIGKGTTLEESVSNDKFIEVGKNCYFGVSSIITSHAIEGIFGNISYFKVKIGDNVTGAAMNILGPGTEVYDNSFLLPLASTGKHSILKGEKYYWGIPLRKIFRKKTMEYLDLTPKDVERNENIEGQVNLKSLKNSKSRGLFLQSNTSSEKKQVIDESSIKTKELTKDDLKIDFTSSSAISKVNIKFLAVYIPIFWLSGMLVAMLFYTYINYLKIRFLIIFFIPAMIIFTWFIFIVSCCIFCKLFLILINLIHKPKVGVFLAEKGNNDFEFWCLRTELKKIAFWLIRYWPIPWMDILAFKWFGIKMSLTSSMHDVWCDGEFIKFGRRIIIGQGATIMSSMIVGKYLIIQEVIFDDYVMIGGDSSIAPGTIIGKESIVGAISTTTYNQILEPGWIYMGIPVTKFKPNKIAESRSEILTKRDVDDEKKFEIEHDINIEKENNISKT